MSELHLTALNGVPLVGAGDDLATLVLGALEASGQSLQDGDVVVIAQKIVSKAEGRMVRLVDVTPSPRAAALAIEVNKDPRLVELILQESTDVVRSRRDVLVVAHRLGFVIANAGIDQSNVKHNESDEFALLLPLDPDATCAALRLELKARTGAAIGVIINDSHGRAFRNGTVGVAIGSAGLSALVNMRGTPDLFSRTLRHTEIGAADEIASAASLLMGQAAEGRPLVLVRGLNVAGAEGRAADLVRAKQIDLFLSPATPLAYVDFVTGRRSIRRYQGAPVSDALIEELVATATTAPSAHNRQPWRFAVLKAAAVKSRLAAAMGEKLRADRTRDGDAPDVVEADVARSIARIINAPVAIIACMSMEDMDSYPDERRAMAERQMAAQGTSMAMQNLLLAAHARGLGACIMCAPLFCPDIVRGSLELPEAWEPQALITLGWSASAGKPYKRRALADIMRVIDGD